MSNELNNIVALNTDGVREGQGPERDVLIVRVGTQNERELYLMVAIEDWILITFF